MKVLVISNVCANRQALESVLALGDLLGVDKAISLGGMIGFGGQPRESIELLREREVFCLRGVLDQNIFEDMSQMNPVAAKHWTWIREELTGEQLEWMKRLPIVHREEGAEYVCDSLEDPGVGNYVTNVIDVEASMNRLREGVCFIGNTGMPRCWVKRERIEEQNGAEVQNICNGTWCFTVGSVGHPGDGDWRGSCAIYDSDLGVTELRRFEYDIDAACSVLKGMGNWLMADRLMEGW